MREAGAARALVLRADVIPEVDGDDRARVVFVQEHVEAVGERVLREGELHTELAAGRHRLSVIRIRERVALLQPRLRDHRAVRRPHALGHRQVQARRIGDDRIAQRAEAIARGLRSSAAASCTAAVSIFIAGAPSAVAAVAMLARVLPHTFRAVVRERVVNLDSTDRRSTRGIVAARSSAFPWRPAHTPTISDRHDQPPAAMALSILSAPPSAESSAGCSSQSRPAPPCVPPRP